MSRIFIATLAGLVVGCSAAAMAQSPGAPGTIADNEGLFVDGSSFKITTGKIKSDAAIPIEAPGTQEIGPAAIIFRANGRLYIVDAPDRLRGHAPGTRSLDEGADGAQPNRLRIEYEPPEDPAYRMVYEMIKERQVLETLQRMLSPFRFPVALTIKTMGCDGLVNSWFSYDASMPTVHLCYELLQDILKMSPAETTPILKIMPHDAVVGQFLFWSLHEVGHAVFHIFEIPIFGREEDAADQFAVYLMLHFGKDQAHRWVEGAAYAAHEFVMDHERNPDVHKKLEKFSSVHGLPEQRFYNGLCLAYGADAVLFADVVATKLLPAMRAENCQDEYQSFDHAFKAEIRPHIDRAMAKSVLSMVWFPEQPLPPSGR